MCLVLFRLWNFSYWLFGVLLPISNYKRSRVVKKVILFCLRLRTLAFLYNLLVVRGSDERNSALIVYFHFIIALVVQFLGSQFGRLLLTYGINLLCVFSF